MTDIEIIQQLENELDKELIKTNKLSNMDHGYTINAENQVTGIGLERLKVIDLNFIISHLKKFKKLNELRLSFIPLSNLTSFAELQNLKILSAWDCQVEDISSLNKLNSLQELILNYNRIKNISPLKELKKLMNLELYENLIVDFSPLNELANLTYLNIGNNQIKNIEWLTKIRQLKLLRLHNNPLSSIQPLENLLQLEVLVLGDAQVNDLSPLKNLTNLEVLYLFNNRISNIEPLENLTNLKELNLSKNRISNIEPLKNLKDLRFLELNGNLISDISALVELKELNQLNLNENKIAVLPRWILDFNMPLFYSKTFSSNAITLFNNPLTSPPAEIVEQGKEAVKNYFKQLAEQEQDFLFEAKMLIVGEPGAGKTSFACKMEESGCDLPEEKDTTKGIEVKQYYFPLRKEDFPGFQQPNKLENRQFRVNLWDFGGQEIYKATHRFFLSKRSLYSLVADSRNEDTDFNYWLHIIEMFGGESPLLIVLNEKHNRKRNIDIDSMRKRFSNISEVIDVNFAEEDKSRLEKLKKAVRYYASQLPLVGSPIPAKWALVREALEKDNHNTISLQEYLRICNNNSISSHKDALLLSQYFHDIGVFLHFQNDSLLKKTIFLNPNWATHAVYKILDHDLIKNKKGRFSKDDAKVIWSEDEYEFIRDELLTLMKKFFLTYQINGSNEYIVPEHLPAEQPDYDWDETDNLFLYYRYELFMPKGIMSLFIVHMNRYISHQDLVWKRGVILTREETKAEVIETYDARRIKIRLSGKNKRDFLTLITEEIDGINSQYEKMKVEKMIPCNCGECKKTGKPYFYEYQDLKRRMDKGKKDVECGISYETVNVRSLIDEVIDIEKLTSEKELGSKGNIINRNYKKGEKIFISYSHKDDKWLEKVQIHLKVLENEGIELNLWDDTKIKAGMKWREEIEENLANAKIAILLVSTEFLASDFITKNELPPLLKKAELDGSTILSLILKPCRYNKNKELSEFQAVNDPSHPLSTLSESEQDEVLVKLMDRVAELLT